MAGLWVVEHKLRVRPLLLFGVVLVILGMQFISIGLLAEMRRAVGASRQPFFLFLKSCKTRGTGSGFKKFCVAGKRRARLGENGVAGLRLSRGKAR